ncbi:MULTISPECIES: DUF6225 family protein [Streptomyces]|uniref:DUF6225 family protein n=2 Tax=Streptomyces TaxID=1883 RepID=A0ACC6PN04_9ACTN|nr:DUF6225 family protein [Streptomyces sp. NBC_01167]
MADMFDHAPQVWTVGRLREVLADVPDETPIHVGVADTPGDFEDYGDYVLVNAEPVELDAANAEPQVQFTLFADAQAGAYYPAPD